MDLEVLKKLSTSFKGIDVPRISMPKVKFPQIEMPVLPTMDLENSIMGDIKKKIEEQNALATQQINILVEQNNLLVDNYNKLKEMFNSQVKSYPSLGQEACFPADL